MRYGYFDDERREYVITRPDTPLPVDQLPGHGGVLRHHLEHGRRLLLLPRRAAAPPDPLPLQQRARRRRAGATSTCATTRPASSGRPRWQPTQHDARRLRVPPRPRLHDDQLGASKGIARRDAVLRAARREPRGLAGPRHQRPATTAAQLSLFSLRRVLPLGRPGRHDQLPAQLLDRRGRGRADGVIYHKTEYRERRDHFAFFACSEPLAGLRHAARGVPRPLPRLGRARSASSGASSANSVAHGWSPHRRAPRQARPWRPARPERSSSCSATRRTRATTSSSRPGVINKTPRQAGDRALLDAASRARRRFDGPARPLGPTCSAYCTSTRRTPSS